jgi:hypothetical protein
MKHTRTDLIKIHCNPRSDLDTYTSLADSLGLEKRDKAEVRLFFSNFRSYHPNSHKASNKNAPKAATTPIAEVMMMIFNAFLRVLRCCSLWYERTLIVMIIIGIQSYSS